MPANPLYDTSIPEAERSLACREICEHLLNTPNGGKGLVLITKLESVAECGCCHECSMTLFFSADVSPTEQKSLITRTFISLIAKLATHNAPDVIALTLHSYLADALKCVFEEDPS